MPSFRGLKVEASTGSARALCKPRVQRLSLHLRGDPAGWSAEPTPPARLDPGDL